MNVTDRLAFQLEEPGDDPISDQVFHILSKTLQPGDESSLEAKVDQITALLPEGRPYTSEVGSFLNTCYELAEQIPYTHPSMIKLVTIIDLCLKSPRFDGAEVVKNGPTWRTQKLFETMCDFSETSFPDPDPAKYLNFQTFVARVYERGIVGHCALPMHFLRVAFDKQCGSTQDGRNACLRAAFQYVLLVGDALYEEVTEDPSKQDRWRKWHEQIRAVAIGGREDKTVAYSQDTVQLAGQAMVAMEAIARLKSG